MLSQVVLSTKYGNRIHHQEGVVSFIAWRIYRKHCLNIVKWSNEWKLRMWPSGAEMDAAMKIGDGIHLNAEPGA